MEMSQGNSLYSYLNKQKCQFFFFLTKKENRRAEQVLSGSLVPVVGGGCGESV
jgi:hypothetical protein